MVPGQIGSGRGGPHARIAKWPVAALLGAVLFSPGAILAQFYPIRIYDETSGLPSTNIISIHQDRSGLMWFVTRGGISSYDGREWKTTPLPDGFPAAFNAVSRWDARDRLWTVAIARSQQIHHFDGERWVAFDGPPADGAEANVVAFDVSAPGSEPRLALSMSDRSLFYFNGSGWDRVELAATGTSLRFHDSQLLVGTDEGLYSAPLDGRRIDVPEEPVLRGEIKALESDPSGFVWVVAETAILQWRAEGAQTYFAPFELPPDAHPAQLSIAPDGFGGTIVSHWNGVLHVDPRSGQIPISTANGLASNGATGIRVDREGNVWIANPRGLSKLTSLRFAGYRRQHGLLQDEVTAIVERSSGEIVLGHPHGVTFFGTPHRVVRFLPDDRRSRVSDLAETPDGRLWAAVSTLGVAEIGGANDVRWRGDLPGDPRSLEVDSHGRLWVVTSEGLFRLADDRFEPSDPSAVVGSARNLIASPRGGIYVASADRGLTLIRDDEHRAWRGVSEASDNVYAALELPDGTLLVGTADGLFGAEGNALVRVTPEVSRPVYFLNRDRGGKIWIGTDNGVMRWAGRRLEHFTAADGLIGRETNRAASLVDRLGRIWTGTESGVTVYRPEFERPRPASPPIVMLDAAAGDSTFDFHVDTQLSRPDDELRFRFAVHSFVDESRVRIRSWLEGHDPDWTAAVATGERELRYRELAPGRYRLRIQAASVDGPWGEVLTGGSITVPSPFWRRAWFVAAGVTMLIGLVMAWQWAWVQRRYALRLERQVEQRLAERREIEDELGRARRLESLGMLAGGIAHDFNNLMMIIMGNLALIRIDPAIDSEGRTRVANAESALRRARDLTTRLMTFSRGGAPVKSAAGIAEVVHESAAFVLSGTSVRAEIDLPQNLWPVEIDAGQMNQVITNLLLNSIEAMPDGGQVSVFARNLPDAPPTLAKGRYIELILSDSGHGIPAESLDRIFDPYFSTKERGSGLGLATSYSIVNRHGGKLTVESTVGRGTTFRIFLPASATPAERQTAPAAKLASGGGGRVLVMDDEPAVREVIESLLRGHGYEVECSADGEAAIERLRAAQEVGRRFDVAILDLTVPGGIGGKETVKRLRALDPELKAVVVSGYSNDPVMANFSDYGFDGCVRKPFQLDELARTVAQLAPAKGDLRS